MRVTFLALTLCGFGRYRDSKTFQFTKGINVWQDGNEAGKTTMASGLAATIFGLPSFNDSRLFGQARFKHWEGAPAFSGELHFLANDEEYRIVRDFAAHRISLQRLVLGRWQEEVGGEHKPGARKPNEAYETKIKELFGISDRELFMETFFVGQPLPQGEKLIPQIQHLLSGSATHYREALATLLSELKGITRYTGRRGVTSQDMRSERELERLEGEIATAEQALAESRQTLEQLEKTSQDLSSLRLRRQEVAAQLQTQKKTLDSWQQWRTLQERYGEALRRQSTIDSAVEQGKLLQQGIQQSERELQLLKELAQHAPSRRSEPDFTMLGPSPLDVVEEAKLGAERISEEWHNYLCDLKSLEEMQAKLAVEYAPFAAADPEVVKLLARYEGTSYRLQAEKDKAEADFNNTLQLQSDWHSAKQEYEEQFADLAALPAEGEALIAEKLELLAKVRQAKEATHVYVQTGAAWPAAAIAAAVAGSVALWLSGIIWLSVAVAAGMFGGVFFGAAYNKKQQQRAKNQAAQARLSAQLQAVDARLGRFATLDEARLGELGSRLQQQKRAARRLEALQQSIPEPGVISALAATKERTQKEFDTFLQQTAPLTRRFPEPVNAYRAWQELQQNISVLQERLASFVRRQGVEAEAVGPLAVSPQKLPQPWPVLATLAKLYNGPHSCAEELLPWLDERDEKWWQQLRRDVESYLRAQAEHRQRQEEAEALLRQKEHREKELSGLLAAHGVAELSALQGTYTDQTNRAARNLAQWEELVANHPGLPATTESDPQALGGLYHRLEADVDALQAEENNLHEKIRELEFAQARLQGKSPQNMAALHLILRELTEKYLRLEREAAALVLAHSELAAAIDRYSSTYRQELAGKASEIYRRFTGNADRSVTVANDFTIGIVQAGREISLPQLSQGARDQLYIALRLAIADLLSAEVLLPFIFDDPFLNWDDSRLEAMRQTLTEIARHRQVILLSHRREYSTWGTLLS